MNTQIMLLCAALLCPGTALAQLGVNCGEHPDVFQRKHGFAWFTSEQLEKRATKRVEPVMPSTPAGFHYDGYVTFKILVDKDGGIGCIWAHGGNPVFFPAVNKALQYWQFKPLLVNGKPVEFVGVMKFHVHAG
jgi:hypothetical protein